MRDKLVDILNESFEKQYNKNLVISAYCTAKDLISHGVTFAEDNNVPAKWIPVSERMPEKGGLYLVCIDVDIWGDEDKAVSIEQYVEMWDGWYVDGCRITNITHWMTMPEPPKEGE